MLMRRPQGLHAACALRSSLASSRASPIKFQVLSPSLGLRARASLIRYNWPRLIPRRFAHEAPLTRCMAPHANTKTPFANTPHPCSPCLAEGRNSSVLVSVPLKASHPSVQTYHAPLSLNDIWATDLDASLVDPSCRGTTPFFHALC